MILTHDTHDTVNVEQQLTTVMKQLNCTAGICVQGYFRTGSFLHYIPFIFSRCTGKCPLLSPYRPVFVSACIHLMLNWHSLLVLCVV